MGFFKSIFISRFLMPSALLLTLLPLASFGGGELSGGGIYQPVGHQYRTAGEARVAFNRLENGSKAYWDPSFGKSIPYIQIIKGSKDRFLADSEVCIDGNDIRSTVPGPKSGEFLRTPLQWEELDCVRWKVDVKDKLLPKTFFSLESAQYFVRDEDDAVGEPYCRDEDWQMMTKTATSSFLVKFYANVRGEKEPIQVGQIRYQLFRCDQLERIADIQQYYYEDFVNNRSDDSSQWIQMAGGELSGGGKPKRAN